jgi:hypothetical protein
MCCKMVCTWAGMLCGEGMTLFVIFDSCVQLTKSYKGIILARLHIIVFVAIIKKQKLHLLKMYETVSFGDPCLVLRAFGVGAVIRDGDFHSRMIRPTVLVFLDLLCVAMVHCIYRLRLLLHSTTYMYSTVIPLCLSSWLLSKPIYLISSWEVARHDSRRPIGKRWTEN